MPFIPFLRFRIGWIRLEMRLSYDSPRVLRLIHGGTGDERPVAQDDETGQRVALPLRSGSLLQRLDALQPEFATQLVCTSDLKIVSAHVFINGQHVAQELDESGTFCKESLLLRLLCDFEQITVWDPIVLGDTASSTACVTSWLLAAESNPMLHHTHCMCVDETRRWYFDTHRRCFFKFCAPPPIRATSEPSGWLACVPAGNARVKWAGAALRSASPGSYCVVAHFDATECLIASSACLIACASCATDEWAAEMVDSSPTVLRSDCDLVGTTSMALALATVVIVTFEVLDRLRLNQYDEDCATLEYQRQAVRRAHAEGALSTLPATPYAVKWRRVLIDDDGQRLSKYPLVARVKWAIVDAPEALHVEELYRFSKCGVEGTKCCMLQIPRQMPVVHVIQFKGEPAISEVADETFATFNAWLYAHLTRHEWLVHVPASVATRVISIGNEPFKRDAVDQYVKGSSTCSVCMTSKSDCLLECGHLFCHICATRARRHGALGTSSCPLCRQDAWRGFVRVKPKNRRISRVAGEVDRQLKLGRTVAVYCACESILHNLCAELHCRQICAVIDKNASDDERKKCDVLLCEFCAARLPPRRRADTAFFMHVPYVANRACEAAAIRRVADLSDKVYMLVLADSPESDALHARFAPTGQTGIWKLRPTYPEVCAPG